MPLPPLVSPAAELDPQEIARYSRHLLLPELGMEGQRRLKAARVLVVGAGGLGSPVILYLAAAGIGTLGIVEFDTVDESNLQRQVIHGVSRLGQPKADSARAAVAELNPRVEVRLHRQRLDNDSAPALFADYDLIVDGTDNFATRYLINDACVLAGKPYVWGSIYRFEGQASVFWEQAPDGRGVNYRDLYPAPPPPELAPSCAEGGVLGVLCAAIGSIMATEAIKLIAGIGESLLGRLAVYDALEMRYRFLPLRRDPQRRPITGLADYPAFCGLDRPAAPDAGRSISAAALKKLRDEGADFALLDVREPAEWDIVRIDGARLLPKSRLQAEPDAPGLDRDLAIVVHCKSGVRSRQAAALLRERGYRDVRELEGGILAWIREVEPTLPSY
ncbi:molybdopterin-synthase adenylyltransferase MoeB [Chitinimonas koreensis]|uniref:molybdopterin-synthase adenylyltransferase MoeB n=1 Tax=Chitinimonas koreensis TaxID=356302 RepID=UPI000424EE57|nr:molybdopterin-synthase adenylyltransferase MoeB [Chitinimonas koreensis]QNM95307.1 molybdopterin-synthase adenylyltransferase MoeB [Chitinimonas koreensis]